MRNILYMVGPEARIHEFCTSASYEYEGRCYIQSMISPTEPRSQAVNHLLRIQEIPD
jgi:hypothetical protein